MRAQKRDANEAAIVEALELAGYAVARHYAPDPFDFDERELTPEEVAKFRELLEWFYARPTP